MCNQSLSSRPLFVGKLAHCHCAGVHLLSAWFLAGVVLLLFAGCSSTRIHSTRTPTAAGLAPLRTMMVVAMDERPEMRTEFEHDLVRYLHRHHVEGTNSHSRFPLDIFKGSHEQVQQQLKAAGVEFVLIARVADRSTPMEAGSHPMVGGMGMEAVYDARYNLYTSGGGDIETDLRIDARLFRVADGLLLWNAIVGTVLHEDYDSIVVMDQVTETIVDRLAHDKVIP